MSRRRKCLVCMIRPLVRCCKCSIGHCESHLDDLTFRKVGEIMRRFMRAGECPTQGSWETNTYHCYCKGIKSINRIEASIARGRPVVTI